LGCVSGSLLFLDHNEGRGGSPNFGHEETKEKVLGRGGVSDIFQKETKMHCIISFYNAMYNA
jgi:hypothetical protein